MRGTVSVALWGDPPLPRLVHLSDRIQRLLEQVDAENADHVLLTGDLTALGDDEELREIRGLLQPLIAARRLTVIPGNHDRYTDAPSARGFERTFSQQLSSDLPEYAASNGYPFVHLVGDRLALVGLDSTRVGGWSHYFFGALGSAQLDGLERLLADPRLHGRTVLVLSHHGPLGPAGTFDWRESGLRDGARLLGILEPRPVVLLHGHSHHRYWHPAADGRPHIFGGGSSTEHASRGYWVIDFDDARRVEAREVTTRTQ